MEALVGMPETVEEMRRLEGERHVEPSLLGEGLGAGQTGEFEGLLDDLPLAHPEPGMLAAKPVRQLAMDIVVGARLGIRLDDLAGELEMRMAARGVDVVVLE